MNLETITVCVSSLDMPQRIDVYLSKKLNISRSQIQKLFLEKQICDQFKKPILKPSFKLYGGETMFVTLPPPPMTRLQPEEIPLDIVYEDRWLIVLNKPKGISVHPGGGKWSGTLANALIAHCQTLSNLNTPLRPGIVHRLDKDTSGLLVVAKTNEVHEKLAKQISARTVKREYWALIEGHISQKTGQINLPVGRDLKNRKRMTVLPMQTSRTHQTGRKAITDYKVLEEFPGYSLLELHLQTGRTHQIRVHLKYIKHPVVGDAVYGKGINPFGIKGQALHARTLGFIHPVTNSYCEFSCPPPKDFLNALEYLKNLPG